MRVLQRFFSIHRDFRRFSGPSIRNAFTLQDLAERIQQQTLSHSDFVFMLQSRERIIFDILGNKTKSPSGHCLPVLELIQSKYQNLNHREKIEAATFLIKLAKKVEPSSELDDFTKTVAQDLKELFLQNKFYAESDPLYSLNITFLIPQPEYEAIRIPFIKAVMFEHFDKIKPYFNKFNLECLAAVIYDAALADSVFAKKEAVQCFEKLSLEVESAMTKVDIEYAKKLDEFWEKLYKELSTKLVFGPVFFRVKKALKAKCKSDVFADKVQDLEDL